MILGESEPTHLLSSPVVTSQICGCCDQKPAVRPATDGDRALPLYPEVSLSVGWNVFKALSVIVAALAVATSECGLPEMAVSMMKLDRTLALTARLLIVELGMRPNVN